MQLVSTDGLGRALGPAFAQHQLTAYAAADAPDGPLSDRSGTWSVAESAAATERLAAAIDIALGGDGPGRAVAVLLADDDRRLIATVRAIWCSGNDVVCIQPGWSAEVIAEVLVAAEADLVVTDDASFRWPGAAVLVLPGPDAVLALPPASPLQGAVWDEHLTWRRAAS